MKVYYRLTEDHEGLDEGSCISEAVYKGLFYLNRPLYEQVAEYELKDLIKYENEEYCAGKGIEFLLFYTPAEFDIFMNKIIDNGVID